LEKDDGLMNTIMGLGPTVRVDEVAAMMVGTALHGSEGPDYRERCAEDKGGALLKGA